MMKKLFIISLMIFTTSSFAKSKGKVIRVAYLRTMFAQLHQNPDRYSQILTTFECGHPFRVMAIKDGDKEKSVFEKDWLMIKSGGYVGYIQKEFVSDKKVRDCFNMKYSKFYDSLNLNLSEMYYWGRLYDQFNYGKSMTQGNGL